MAKKVRRPGQRGAGRFVLDSSVALAWYFADEKDAYADGVARALASAHARVPSLWPLEIAHALVVGERRERCTAGQSATFLRRLASLPIEIAAISLSDTWDGVVRMARVQRLSAYDATYLELALREGLPLATLDVALAAAAKAAGVRRFEL